MTPIEPDGIRALIEAVIGGFSVLGGAMACASGFYAYKALAQEASSDVVAHRVNEGIGRGFGAAWPLSILALAIMIST